MPIEKENLNPEIDSKNNGKVFDVRKKVETGSFLKLRFRKLGQALSEWKLKRLRAKILKAENSRRRPGNNFKFPILNFKSNSNLIISKLKNSFKIENLKFKIKKPRFHFKLNLRNVYLKKALALTTIAAVIATAYFQNTPYASAATFTL